MDKFRNKLILIMAVFGLLLSIVVIAITLLVVPTFNLSWLIGTSLYFLLIELAIILFVDTVSRQHKKDKKRVNAYLLTKVVKIIISLFIIAIYLLIVKIDIKPYLIVFASYYFSYLLIETILFTKIENRLKKEAHEV